MKSPWISYWRENADAELRLFCLPYAGGSATIFRNWPAYFEKRVEIGMINLPGRTNRVTETPMNRLEPLVQSLVTALLPELNKPFAIFGHSMGATIGFECVRELRRRKVPLPVRLFVSGRPAPQVSLPYEDSYRLPDPLFIDLLKSLNGTPPSLFEQPELLELLMPVLRADFELIQTYAYAPDLPLSCPITAFGGLKDPQVLPAEVNAWRVQTTADFRVRMFDGDHFFLHSCERLLMAVIANELRIRPICD